MPIPIDYVYLIGLTPCFVIWGVLFLARKDVRKEMLVISIMTSLGSIATSYMWWTKDWWLPPTITGTIVGIEDLILGFTVGGIAAVLYEEIYKKKLYKKTAISPRFNFVGIALILISTIIIGILFWVGGLTSFYAATIAMIMTITIIVAVRKDLLLNSIVSGILMLIVATPAYFLIEYFSPGWIEITYPFSTLSGIKISIIPIEELVFWLLFGMLIGPFYEFWKGMGLRKQR